MIDLLPTHEQREITDSIAAFLSAKLPVERHRTDAGRRGESETAVWTQLSEIGCFGLSVPEDAGGVGLTLAEEVLAFREYGRALVSPTMLATVLAARIAYREHMGDVLEKLLSGTIRAALAIPVHAHLGTVTDGEFSLLDAGADDWVLAWDETGIALFEPGAFSNRRRIPGMDASLQLDVATLRAVRTKAWISATADPFPHVGTVLTAAMLVGIGEASRDMAVEYAKTRHQFGVAIGSFQAIKHRCADMALHAEAAWSQTVYAALALRARHADALFQATTAKYVATKTALDNASANIQIHGGMGFTAELNAHLYLKRAHVLNQVGGAMREQERRLLEFRP